MSGLYEFQGYVNEWSPRVSRLRSRNHIQINVVNK
jgi:hypothetical protein